MCQSERERDLGWLTVQIQQLLPQPRLWWERPLPDATGPPLPTIYRTLFLCLEVFPSASSISLVGRKLMPLACAFVLVKSMSLLFVAGFALGECFGRRGATLASFL